MNIKFVSLLLIICSIILNRGTDAAVSRRTSSEFSDGKSEMKYANFDSYNNQSPLEYTPKVCDQYDSEKCATKWLKEAEKVLSRNVNRLNNARYKYALNMSDDNRADYESIQNDASTYQAQLIGQARKFKRRSFKNVTVKRSFEILAPHLIDKDKEIEKRIKELSQNMSFIRYQIKYDRSNKTDLYEKKAEEWKSVRDQIGPTMRQLFIERRNLLNIIGKENGFNDMIQLFLWQEFEQTKFNETVMQIYNEIFPLYQQFHAIIRHCLWQHYPNKFDKDGLIPDHIVFNVYPIIRKCYGPNVTNNIREEVDESLSKITIKDMVKMSERFYESIGLFKMTDKFWKRSIFIKPESQTVDCKKEATDFYIGTDFRLKICMKKKYDYISAIHGLMGNVEYYMADKDLPAFLRGEPNPSFSYTVRQTIKLLTTTPEYLKTVDLIKEVPQSNEFDIDYLMEKAFSDVFTIVGAVGLGVFNWGAYNGSVSDGRLNEYWWNVNRNLMGFKPPFNRSVNNFDPAFSSYVMNAQSLMHFLFVSVSSHTFYESMCKEAGEYSDLNSSKPLHRCNFYGSKKAGKKLLDMMKQGKKQHWSTTMQILTGSLKPGENVLNVKSLMKYYKPLYDWLKDKNKKLNIKVGW